MKIAEDTNPDDDRPIRPESDEDATMKAAEAISETFLDHKRGFVSTEHDSARKMSISVTQFTISVEIHPIG